MSETSTKILYCRCAHAQVVPPDVKDEVLRNLTEADVSFQCVTDLCEMSARRDPLLNDLAASAREQPVKIAACYPRAVKWLFHAAGAPLPADEQVEVLNMRDESAASVSARLLD